MVIDKETQRVIDYLKDYVHYDPLSGILSVKNKPKGRQGSERKVGDVLGYLDGRGYLHLAVLGKKYKAHRLAWLYTYGKWPKDMIDHIDGNRTNNTINNLREANNLQNQINRSAILSYSGYKGVYPSRNEKGEVTSWNCQCAKIHIGVYVTKSEAAIAYDKYVLRKFGEFAKTNLQILGGYFID
jgi:hypothetical protein